MAASPSAPHQMQVRVTFYTSHNPQSVLMILKNDQALAQVTEKAKELFPSAEYRLFYGDVNGPIYEFIDSEQLMSKIRITTFSRTPQLFVRLESVSSDSNSSSNTKKAAAPGKESKSGACLRRIEMNQDLTLQSIQKLSKDVERISALEAMVASLQCKDAKSPSETEKVTRPFPPAKHSASCDACLGDIIGHRYKCLECADYDLCEKCEKKSVHYEHAMIRLVSPSMTKIPAYVANNSPNNVFPAYMQSMSPRVSEYDKKIFDQLTRELRFRSIGRPSKAPAPAPAAATAPAPAAAPAPAPAPAASFTGPEARFFNEETCAALINSASVLKDTFSTLSKSFMDLADGAQASMDKKIIERSTMEAGVKKVEEKVENLKRHCEEKCFGIPVPDAEKVEESSKKSSESSSAGPKIKKAKKKTVYKKSSEKLVAMSLAAAVEEQAKAREEAKKRADASTAELQRKLAELNMKPAPVEPTPCEMPPVTSAPQYSNSLEALMRAILSSPVVVPTTTPVAEPASPTLPSPVASAPIFQPIYPTVETLIVPPLPAAEPKPEAVVPPQATAPISIHSSFENIPSDFESISPSWGHQAVENPQEQEAVVDDLLEFEEVLSTPATTRSDESSPASLDAATEKTFDRLLEMGFDYNVVVSAIKANGSDLEKCLLSLLQ